MLKAFEKNIQKVRVRCSINLLLKYSGQVLIAAAVIALLVVLAEKLLAVSIININTSVIFVCIFATVILAIWLYKQPNKMQISLLLDERMKLKERFSTAMKISSQHDEFSEAACNEALDKAQSLNLKGHFPIKLSKGWTYTSSLWLIVILLFAYLPQKDLLGLNADRDKQNKVLEKKELAKSQVTQAATKIKERISQIKDPNLAEALSKLDQLSPTDKPQDIKRAAIRQLADLSEQVKNLQKSESLESLKMMEQMLKQLKGSPDSFAQKLRMELAKGNFKQASAILQQMRNELEKGDLSQEQQKQLAEQMRELAKALENLAQQSGQLEKELEAMGLDKGLSKMSQQQLREALEKQGLSSEKIEDLLNKAAASNMAREKLSQMANAMAASGSGSPSGEGLSSSELGEAIEQLSSMEALQQQMQLTEASLREIANAMNGLGQGMGQGLGEGTGDWREGDTGNMGNGTGGPGMGSGERPADTEGQYNTEKGMVKKPPQKGPVIASWYFKDVQVEGEAKRSFSEVIQAGRDSAAEAISDNEIPRKYEETIKKYFGNIEDAVPLSRPDNGQE